MTTAEALAVVREALTTQIRLAPADCTGDCDFGPCNCSGKWSYAPGVDAAIAALALIEERLREWERMEERWHSVESKVLMHDDALARAEKAEAERDNATAALERMRLELVRVDGMVSRYSQSADAVSEDRARWMERYAELEAALREYVEFYEAWWEVEKGVADFDLHEATVVRLRKAHDAIAARRALGGGEP